MERGSVFMNNKTQAIRPPKSVRLPDGTKVVDIERRGRAWIVVPSDQSWAHWFEEADVSPDFMDDRGQPGEQERAAL